jgi:hypothetical protein
MNAEKISGMMTAFAAMSKVPRAQIPTKNADIFI